MENEVLVLDKKLQGLIKDYVPQAELLRELVDFFSIFADETRLKMLSALAISDMCVTDLSVMLEINQTTISHQLRLLKNLGAVSGKRNGKIILYSLRSELLNDVLLKGVEYIGCGA